MSDGETPKKRRGGRQRVVVEFPGLKPEDEPGHMRPREDVIPRPGSKDAEDTRTAGARYHAGKRWSDIMDRIAKNEITWEDIVSEMDEEELARRQFRASTGTFVGRPPARPPLKFVQACDRELISRGALMWRSAYEKAIGTLVSIAESEEAKESDRIKAATLIIERIEGKVPDRVVVSAGASGETVDEILMGVVAKVSAEEAENAAIGRAHDYTSRIRGEGQ